MVQCSSQRLCSRVRQLGTLQNHGADSKDNLKFSLAYIIANLHEIAAARNRIPAPSFLPLKIHHGQCKELRTPRGYSRGPGYGDFLGAL